MTSAEARFNNSLRPRKPEGSLGRTAPDGHLGSHIAPELCDRQWPVPVMYKPEQVYFSYSFLLFYILLIYLLK